MFSGDSLESICFKGKPVNASVFTAENSNTFNDSLTTITWPSPTNAVDSGVDLIYSLPELKFLTINCNNGVDTGIMAYSQLEKLEFLKLNKVKGIGTQEISSLSQLRVIDIVQDSNSEQAIISSGAITNCSNLEVVNIYKISGSPIQIQSSAFSGSNSNLKITVPFGTLEEYKTASPSYASIMVERTEVK